MSFRFSRGLYCIACAIPFITLIAYLWQYTVNAPYHDDYDWGVLFLYDFLHLESNWDKLRLIFTYHCEHRIIYTRSVILTYFFSTGGLNFKYLAILGNLWLCATPFLFYRQLRNFSNPLLYFLPIPLLFLNLQCFPNLFTTFGLTNNTSLFFILLVLYILSYYQSKTSTFLAFSLAIWVTFIAANGMFVWPLGFFLILLKSQKKVGIYWLIAATLSIAAYFLIEKQYWKIDFVGPRPLWIILVNTPIYFPTFLFSFLDVNQTGGKLYSMLGVLLSGTLILWNLWKYRHQLYQLTIHKTFERFYNLTPDQRFLLAAIGLVLITDFLCLVYRSGLGFNKWVIKDRYRIYSQLFWVCIYIWGLQTVKVSYQKKWVSFFLSLSTLIWMGSYYFITPELKAFSQKNYDDLKHYSKYGTLKYYDYHKEADRKIATDKSIEYLFQKGYLHIPNE